MQTNMNYVSVARDAAEEYIKECNFDTVITDEMVDDKGKVMCAVYQSKSQYNGIRSSIAYLYTLARVQQPAEIQKEISTFLKGMDRMPLKDTGHKKFHHLIIIASDNQNTDETA